MGSTPTLSAAAALVVQWIERGPPEAVIAVRLCTGAPMNILGFIEDNLKDNGNDAIPEIRALREVVENNSWHDNQSVFEHTKQVIKSLKQYANNELLLLATLFHDIAKPKVFICDGENGMTICPTHEEKGSIMMDMIGPKIGLMGDDLQYVKRIIEMHGLPHLLVNALMEHKNEEDSKKKFFTQTGLYAKDLLVHALADMEGSDLPRIDPVFFRKRKTIMEMLIRECH